MGSSIRVKMVVMLMGSVIAFTLLMLTLSSLLLKPYYISMKQKNLLESYCILEEVDFFSDRQEVELAIEKLEETNNIQVYIIDFRMHEFYCCKKSSNVMTSVKIMGSDDPDLKWFNPWMVPHAASIAELFSEKPYIAQRTNRRLSAGYISLYAKSVRNRGDKAYPYYIIINTPIAAVEEGVGVFDGFAMIAAAVVIAAGTVLMFVLGSKAVEPVVRMNEAAKRMAELDFSDRIPVRSNDEVGQLASSINNLSGQLEAKINELSIANRQLTQDLREKEKIDAMRVELISNVSHELKTPLAIILGYCEGLQLNVNSEERDYYCSVIQDEAAKINLLAARLLDLAELESGGSVLELSEFSLAELAAERLRKMGVLLSEKGISADISASGDCIITGDEARIEEVINNLLSNAVNHTPENGRIEVTVLEKVDEAVFMVYNSGSRIPEESLDRVWDSFYKVDKARTRKYGGTGLGLKIVSTILKSHTEAGIKTSYDVVNTESGVCFSFTIAKSDNGSERKEDTDERCD